MNNYQRLEINLLPPEMAPGPAVRVTSLFNMLLVGVALLFIGIHFFGTLGAIKSKQKDSDKLAQDIIQAQPIVDEYMALKDIQDNTEGRGKLVGMASATYVEFPVILDRVSRLLPEGVYLVKTSSGGGGGRGDKEIMLNFRTATGDPSLMSRTLEAFKTSPMFTDPYLRTGDLRPEPLEEVSSSFGIPYTYQNGGGDNAFVSESYDFEIRAQVNSPLEIDDLGTVMDKSDLMLPFELKTDPSAPVEAPPAATPPAEGAAGGAPAQPAAPPAAGGATPPAGGAAPAAGGAG